jgi:hypothetical protein
VPIVANLKDISKNLLEKFTANGNGMNNPSAIGRLSET